MNYIKIKFQMQALIILCKYCTDADLFFDIIKYAKHKRQYSNLSDISSLIEQHRELEFIYRCILLRWERASFQEYLNLILSLNHNFTPNV